MQHTKHVFRALLLLVAVIVTYILVRGFFVPKSYGMYGPYRYDNIAEQRDKPLIHGALGACQGCHGAVAEKVGRAKHATVPCEDCHAPLSTHVAAGKRIAAMVKDPSYQLCVRCHRKLPARPAAVIKQIVPEEHVTSQGETLQGNVCTGCHDVHSPQMGDDGDKGKDAKAPKAEKPPEKKDEKKDEKAKDAKPEKAEDKAPAPKADKAEKKPDKAKDAEGGAK